MFGFLASRALFGFVLSGVCVWWLMAADVAHLRTLSGEAGAGLLPAVLLFFFLGLTFASLHMGIAVMMQARVAPGGHGDDIAEPDPRKDPRFKSNYSDRID
jgi:hypothetical protein